MGASATSLIKRQTQKQIEEQMKKEVKLQAEKEEKYKRFLTAYKKFSKKYDCDFIAIMESGPQGTFPKIVIGDRYKPEEKSKKGKRLKKNS